MKVSEFYRAGKLNEALAAALEEVKKHPTEVDHRGLLCEMICFKGDFERVDKQLDTMSQQNPDSAVGVAMFRQIIRAEISRQQFFDDGKPPELTGEPSAVIQLHLEASVMIREGDLAGAAKLLQQAEQARPRVGGECDGEAFDDFRDLDDLCAPVLEILTSTGKYFWTRLETITSIEFHPPERPRDLVWRRAHVQVTDGPEGEVFIPAIYPATVHQEDEQLLLGRGTSWLGGEGEPIRGVGLRMFLVGEQDKSIMQIENITFNVEGEADSDDEPAEEAAE